MPTKLRLRLEGDRPRSPFQHTKGLRALMLDFLHSVDADLAATLHEVNQPKPYAISPIGSDSENARSHWFEISVLTDWLLEPLLHGIERHDRRLRLGPQTFQLAGWEPVLAASWGDFFTPMPRPAAGYDFVLQTPTAHHAAGEIRKSVVLPSPELYFGSWIYRWQLCTEWPLPPGLAVIVAEHLAVCACAGATREVRLDAGRSFIGFEGTVSFTLLQPEMLPPMVRDSLTALARFATFCGTGVETSRGMGQTQLQGLRSGKPLRDRR